MDFSEENLSRSDVVKFFAGQTIFITGGSGFVGKAILEKLLRCCPDIRLVYLLIRSKKGSTAGERLNKMLQDSLFTETLNRRGPEAWKKVHAVSGDVLQPDLGLCPSDRQKLTDEVSIVIHSAASVRFDDPLREAIDMNMGGTKRLLELAKHMVNLKSVVHISTAYTNCTQEFAEEKIYDLPHSTSNLFAMAANLDDAQMAAVTPSVLEPRFPNTYTCTKAYAEHVVREFQDELPISIVRPSIVLASWKEPFTGWLDNVNGPSGLLVVTGLGLLQVAPPTSRDVFPDFVPLDLVVNSVLVAAKHRVDPGAERLPVYHATVGQKNRLSWQRMRVIGLKLAREFPPSRMFRYPRMDVAANQLHYKFRMFWSHYVPAQLLHGVLSLMGKPSNIARKYQRLVDTIEILRFFYVHDPVFKNLNNERLFTSLSDTDKYLFPMLADSLDWDEYMTSYLFGIRYFLIKEDLSTVPAARKRLML
ncbi:putative fatty acyl-CoA reductase-like [Tropilaelaps mercedesae]|uniref:Fatty acyl-CoA reductase n=1 Tax=Tropilaelaps mercedesae TaxID=418985 RepID=A0A1V9Y229_9ACAR|nr:putative fatty acyl-CoA reductase-like [Tropilaelaps mercedesae]